MVNVSEKQSQNYWGAVKFTAPASGHYTFVFSGLSSNVNVPIMNISFQDYGGFKNLKDYNNSAMYPVIDGVASLTSRLDFFSLTTASFYDELEKEYLAKGKSAKDAKNEAETMKKYYADPSQKASGGIMAEKVVFTTTVPMYKGDTVCISAYCNDGLEETKRSLCAGRYRISIKETLPTVYTTKYELTHTGDKKGFIEHSDWLESTFYKAYVKDEKLVIYGGIGGGIMSFWEYKKRTLPLAKDVKLTISYGTVESSKTLTDVELNQYINNTKNDKTDLTFGTENGMVTWINVQRRP